MSQEHIIESEPAQQPKKRSKTLIKILKHAHDLLWQRGYAGMSLNDLVAKAKISKGGFFHYFPNKKSVVETVLDDYFAAHITARFERHMHNANNAIEAKAGFFNWLEDSYNLCCEKNFREGCMIGNLTLEISDQDEELRERLKAYFITWENQIVDTIKPYYQSGNLLMEPRQFARMFIATYQGIIMTCKTHRDHNRASRDFQALGEFIERIIIG